MQKAQIVALMLLLTKTLAGQFYTPVFPNLDGEALKENVVQSYKPTHVLDYGEARDVMYGIIDNINDTVTCVYSGHQLYLPPNVDPSTHLYMNASTNGINAEHTCPRSKGADEDNGNAFSDLHHLFPTRTGVNTARSNLPFGEINDNQASNWYFRTIVLSNIPNANIDAYSERTATFFEPRESHKGNVARAMFYFYTMYEEEMLEADPDFFELQRNTLCEWHENDPVDAREWERTYAIAAYQNDLPNPFILDCSLAQRSYCQDLSISCPTVMPTASVLSNTPVIDILLYPNPIIHDLHIKAKGSHTIRLIDMLGTIQHVHSFVNEIHLDVHALAKGTYMVLVDEQSFLVVK